MRKLLSTLLFTLGLSLAVFAQDLVCYKQIDTTTLMMDVYFPPNLDKTKEYPAMVFFFGGGWQVGSRQKFAHHAADYCKQGIVCFVADYRIESIHGTTPFESLKDAKSAIRYVRAHAEEYHVNPSQIIASGGSAGGHLAAASTMCNGYNEDTDDLSVSCKADALVLYNAVLDISPGGYGYDRIGEEYKDFSPLHNIKKGTPPTIIFLGTKDHIIPVEMVKYYEKAMNKVKSKCKVCIYEDGKHGFFNYNKKNPTFYNETTDETMKFIESLGFITYDITN